jgi:hypothetical protein
MLKMSVKLAQRHSSVTAITSRNHQSIRGKANKRNAATTSTVGIDRHMKDYTRERSWTKPRFEIFIEVTLDIWKNEEAEPLKTIASRYWPGEKVSVDCRVAGRLFGPASSRIDPLSNLKCMVSVASSRTSQSDLARVVTVNSSR